MTDVDLAGIVARDAEFVDIDARSWRQSNGDSTRGLLADRRALLGLLRETRETIETEAWNAALTAAEGAVVDLPCRHAADFGAGPYADPGPCLVESEEALSRLAALRKVSG